MPQRLYRVLKPCQRAVGSPRNTPKNIQFVRYSVCTTSSQRPNRVHTTFPQRLYSVHDVFTARKQLIAAACSQRAHDAHTASSRRLKRLRFFPYFIFEQPYFANIVIYFYFSKQFVIGFNSCWNVLSQTGLATYVVTHIIILSSVYWIAFIMMRLTVVEVYFC